MSDNRKHIVVHVRNVLGVKEVKTHWVSGRPLFITGMNHKGKTGFAYAVGATVAQNVRPFGGTSLSSFRNDEVGRAEVSFVQISTTDTVPRLTWNIGEQVVQQGNNERVIAPKRLISVGLVDPTMTAANEATRVAFWESQFLPDESVAIAALEAKLREVSIGEQDIRAIMELVNEDGWNGAHKIYVNRRKDFKAQWMAVTGRNYGSQVAAIWQPDGWRQELDGLALSEAQGQKVIAEEELKKADTSDSVSLEVHAIAVKAKDDADKARKELAILEAGMDEAEAKYKLAKDEQKFIEIEDEMERLRHEAERLNVSRQRVEILIFDERSKVDGELKEKHEIAKDSYESSNRVLDRLKMKGHDLMASKPVHSASKCPYPDCGGELLILKPTPDEISYSVLPYNSEAYNTSLIKWKSEIEELEGTFLTKKEEVERFGDEVKQAQKELDQANGNIREAEAKRSDIKTKEEGYERQAKAAEAECPNMDRPDASEAATQLRLSVIRKYNLLVEDIFKAKSLLKMKDGVAKGIVCSVLTDDAKQANRAALDKYNQARDDEQMVIDYSKALTCHTNITNYDGIVKLLSASGVRGAMLGKERTTLNDCLKIISDRSGWFGIVLNAKFEICVASRNNRPVALMSVSERWIVRASLQIAISHIAGDAMIILDEASVLDDANFGGLCALVDWLGSMNWLVMVCYTTDESDTAKDIAKFPENSHVVQV